MQRLRHVGGMKTIPINMLDTISKLQNHLSLLFIDCYDEQLRTYAYHDVYILSISFIHGEVIA